MLLFNKSPLIHLNIFPVFQQLLILLLLLAQDLITALILEIRIMVLQSLKLFLLILKQNDWILIE